MKAVWSVTRLQPADDQGIDVIVRVFSFPSHKRWNSAVSKPSRLSHHRRENELSLNPVKDRLAHNWAGDRILNQTEGMNLNIGY